MKRPKIITPAVLAAALTVIFAVNVQGQEQKREEDEATLVLKIGDPKLKDKTLDIAPDNLYSAALGKAIPFSRMIREMRTCRFVYVGETHNSLPMHDIQFQVLKALHEQDRNLVVGLEMLPVGTQQVLNAWSLGLLAEDEFIRDVRWYVNWNFHFGFYEKILRYAKDHKIPVYALNIPREVITKIRMQGWEALTGEEKKLIPQAPDLKNQDHRTLVRTIFETMEMPPQMKGAGLDMVFEGLYRSQSAWDEVMAANALIAAEREGKKVVVFAGSGHIIYNLGISRRAYEKSGLPSKTLVCVSVPKDAKAVKASRSLADYIWGLREEERPAFPSVGLTFKKFEGLENLVIDSKPNDGVAKGQDFEKGDIVLAVDGKGYADINELRTALAKCAWGAEAKFRLLRAGQVREVKLKFVEAAEASADSEKK